ncbi:MAG: discoidin domain-containing protein, partial [Oscillospiraceae bacterium]|nr:discoidin domain-containing protein [Oscillospiraceae bacterium]
MGISKNDFDKRMNYPETSKPAVRSQINGIPIYQFGNAAFYSESPKLIDDDIVQINNKNNPEKCRLKKSWEIKKNYIGATTPRMPCTPANDFHPLQCINLIDGNDDTCWMSMRHNIPDEQPEWIRIDLAKEREIHKIILKKRSNIPSETRDSKYYNSLIGCAIPSHLTIKVSSDAHDWKTVFEGDPYAGAENDVNRHIFEIDIAALRVKQIWIIGDVLSKCDMGYAFSIASVELYDEKKRNVALASYGNGITASSIFYYVQQERETFDWFWPLHFDLGLTWSRIGYHNDMINWHWVEQEKGVLKIDEEAEKAIDLLVKNGVNIVYVLAFGNRLYQESPVRDISFHQWQSAPPKSDEALVGWENFVRFSVNYFKDRIEYFEIWNEWNGPDYWGAVPDTEHYIKLAKITARIIRECAPDAKVILGSYAGFCHGISKWSETEIAEKEKNYDFFQVISALAPLVDVIGFHPWYGSVDTKSEYYMEYTDNLRAFKRYFESKGFDGKRYMASEFNVSANYPPMSAE